MKVRTMATRRRKTPLMTRLGMFVRARRFDRNPLRRASDRVETAVLAVLVVAFLAAAPFTAMAAGAWMHAVSHGAQVAQEAARRDVPARVLEVASQTPGSGGYYAYAASASLARARWTAPDGKVITGEMPVPAGTAAGATVRVWVTSDGQLTDQPLQDSQVTDSVVTAEILAVTGLGVLLLMTGVLARRALDRHRLAAWDAEWRATGPRGTTRK